MVEDIYISELIKHDIRFSIHSITDIKKLANYAQRDNKKVKAHIFINTGMNMLGVDYINSEQSIEEVMQHPYYMNVLEESWNPKHNKHIKRCIRTCAYNKAYQNEIVEQK